MKGATKRETLRQHNGQRLRVIATIARWGSRQGYRGPEETVLLTDLVYAETGVRLADHLWFKVGKWVAPFSAGDRIAFEARATAYEKGYRGRREDVQIERPVSRDWRLERPTQVRRLPSC